MQSTKTTRNSLKKLFGTVAAGVFIALPLASTLAPAEAAPLLLAKNERNNNRKNRDIRTLEGVVTADRQGRDFILLLDNGQRVTVRSNEREPRRLSTGDRVRVVGAYRRNQPTVFRADVVVVLTNQNNNNGARTYTGRVSKVDSDQRFDLVIGNTTYNVLTSSRLPRRLNVNDRVRVYGRRTGDNDITGATVVVINNNNNNNEDDNYRTYTGRVSNVDSDQRFDLVVGNTTYNVLTSSRLPRRLNEGDRVRVYGIRTGDNDISRATVVVINDNNDDDNGNNGSDNDYRTYTGRVTDIASGERFAIEVDGITYNVMTSSRLPRDLDEGDRVRVYGRRSGDNDIVNATVSIVDNR